MKSRTHRWTSAVLIAIAAIGTSVPFERAFADDTKPAPPHKTSDDVPAPKPDPLTSEQKRELARKETSKAAKADADAWNKYQRAKCSGTPQEIKEAKLESEKASSSLERAIDDELSLLANVREAKEQHNSANDAAIRVARDPKSSASDVVNAEAAANKASKKYAKAKKAEEDLIRIRVRGLYPRDPEATCPAPETTPPKKPKPDPTNYEKPKRSEDDPLYLDGYTPKVAKKPRTRPKSDDGPLREEPQDEPTDDNTNTAPEIPIPH